MKALIEEYGHAILTFLVVIALLGIIVLLLATDGPVKSAFESLINDFFKSASAALPSATLPPST